MTTLPYETAEISQIATIQAIVEVYVTEVDKVRRAYDTLETASNNLTAARQIEGKLP